MKRTVNAGIFISLALLIFAVTSFAYAADPALIEAVKKEGQISIYSTFPRRFVQPVCKLFKEMYNLGDDFKVNFTRKGTGATIQMVEAEQMSGVTKWDVVSHSDESTFLRWIDQDMLMKYQPPNIGNIRDVFQDPLGCRVAGQISMSSIALHKKRVPEKDWPKAYKDVLDPKWKGRIGLSNPATAGPAVMFTKFMVEVYGWEFFRKLGRNQPILTKGNSALDQLLLSGEIDLALCPNEFSIVERIQGGETNLESLYPEPGCAFYIMWTGMNKNSPRPNAAKLWMEFTADDERQRFVTEVAGRYITSKNVKLAVPRPDLKFYKIDWQWIKVNKDDMSKRFIEEIQRGKQES